MEENENNNNNNVVETNTEANTNVEANVNENADANTTKTGSIVETLKAKKNLIIGIIIAIILIFLVFNVVIGSPKKAVKKFYSAMNSRKAEKIFKNVDWAGVYVFAKLDKDDYDDFWGEYKDYTDSDEWEDAKENLDDSLDDAYDTINDSLDDAKAKFKVKKIKKVKKLGKNLWEVKAQVEMKEDGDKETNTSSYYVMKKGGKYYLVGGGILSAYSYLF